MTAWHKRFIVVAVVAMVGLAVGGWWMIARAGPRLLEFPSTSTIATQPAFSYDDYVAALSAYVDDRGMVDYPSLKDDRQQLDTFAALLARVSAEQYEKWSAAARIAFWINAYNALTLEAILEHYPIKASLAASLIYPENSIRQIPGVWGKLQFRVTGRRMTLNQIEHDTLRTQFDEPRIHMALVCAAMGCPPLRNEPYLGDKLDAQLDDQTRRFLAHPDKFRIDRDANTVFLSPIFKWFGQDFVKRYGTDQKFTNHNDAQRAVLNFASRYLEPDDRRYLETGTYRIEYTDYDWSLNQQETK